MPRSVQKFQRLIHLVQERSYTPYIHVDPHHQSINLAFEEKDWDVKKTTCEHMQAM